MNTITFNDIFASYERPMYNYVLRMIKHPEAAEEVTQDIFVKIARNLSTFCK